MLLFGAFLLVLTPVPCPRCAPSSVTLIPGDSRPVENRVSQEIFGAKSTIDAGTETEQATAGAGYQMGYRRSRNGLCRRARFSAPHQRSTKRKSTAPNQVKDRADLAVGALYIGGAVSAAAISYRLVLLIGDGTHPGERRRHALDCTHIKSPLHILFLNCSHGRCLLKNEHPIRGTLARLPIATSRRRIPFSLSPYTRSLARNCHR